MSEHSGPAKRLEGRGPITIEQVRNHLTAAGITNLDGLLDESRKRIESIPEPDLWYVLWGSELVFIVYY